MYQVSLKNKAGGEVKDGRFLIIDGHWWREMLLAEVLDGEVGKIW